MTRKLAKSRTPARIEQALVDSGMDSGASMGPGRALQPWKGYSQRPRSTDYPVGVNISTQSRGSWGRTSFSTINAIIDSYDIARACINHVIDELRSMEPMFLPLDGFKGDTETAVAAARAALAFPDRELPYDAWLSKWLENVLRYDAAPLYYRRNLNGDIIGLEVVDGTTIAPYVDENGRRPKPPAPAFSQIIHGQVWNWFTSDDIEYAPFRPQTNSPYGLAPIEAMLLNANTDLRFQWHFLQMFTEGSVPAGFIELPPDVTSPDQVAEWQDYWDATVLGDQAKLHQLLAVPNGTKIAETRPKAFDKTFPEYLASRTAMAFSVVPQDLGIVQDVNRANGETQTDIQFRVNTLPKVRYVEGALSRYIARLGLPIKISLDTGRDKEDRLQEAQAWEIYIRNGLASPDEGRSELLGLPTDNQNPLQRFVFTERGGPIPLSAIQAVSGATDAESFSPLVGAELPHHPFTPVEGVTPQKPPSGLPLAVKAFPADNQAALVAAETPVAKEQAAFSRFVKARAKAGRWRDFQFSETPEQEAHRLNAAARAAIRKAAGETVAAGLAVRAEDTGRVLMLQRSFDEGDPAGGKWEFPGGHLEDGEIALQAAQREWCEETGLPLPEGTFSSGWTSGLYTCYMLSIPFEGELDLNVQRPADPDGDGAEELAWWEPRLLVGNPAIRAELAAVAKQVRDVLTPSLLKSAWEDHPVRRVEDELVAAHADPIRSALAGTLNAEQAHTLAAGYLARRK